MTNELYDLVVIGGGINGAGIAADASGRGLRVLLVDAGDLGGATSSASSKLIHGGLRYLEHLEFALVREALGEREVLLRKAPHIVWPLQFVLPRAAGSGGRPAWMLRAGLFIYDHLSSRRTLGQSRAIDFNRDPAGQVLDVSSRHGFSYWDCGVDDARLVVLNAMVVAENGGEVLTQTAVTGLGFADAGGVGRLWKVRLASGRREVLTRALVNAAGPWVDRVAALATACGRRVSPKVRLVKGSHIVVPRIAGADTAFLLQNDDGRVVFLIPFAEAFTLIGTTESAVEGDPRDAHVTDEDRHYLIQAANRFLRHEIAISDIVWAFAGVRPLEDDGQRQASAVSRDYRLLLDIDGGAPPLLHVVGGKITTYRRLAEDALSLLSPHLPMGDVWTGSAPLPGGDIPGGDFDLWLDEVARQYPAFGRTRLRRWGRRYGTRLFRMLGDARSDADLGDVMGGVLCEREIAYVKAFEFASRAEDVIWRRTKAGLDVTAAKREAFAEHVQGILDRV